MLKRLFLLIAVAAALGAAAAACSRPDSLPFGADDSAPTLTTDSQTTVPATSTPASSSTVSSTVVLSTVVSSTSAAPATTVPATTTFPPTTSPHPPGVLMVGDSILEGLRLLQYSFGPNTIYDTEVSRSAVQLPTVLEAHQVPQALVVHLGTNGWWPDVGSTYSAEFEKFADRQIVLVNIRVDRPYTDPANIELQAVADEHAHVTLVDWHQIATPALLREDGFHPNLDGYDALARLIADALGLAPDAQLTTSTTAQERESQAGLLVRD